MIAEAHHHHHHGREAERRALAGALALILGFMAVEVVVGLLAGSLALLSDAAHMLTDAGALALSLAAARLAARPATGALTYGLGRAEILSAQVNGMTMLVLGIAIVAGAVLRLISSPRVLGGPVLAVAAAGIVVNLLSVWILRAPGPSRSLNLEGSFRHLVTDLFGFIATATAAVVILATGWRRADAVASLLVAGLMLQGAAGLLKQSGRVFMEAAPTGIDPQEIGRRLAAQAGVREVHDLHVWEVTSGFPALSAHVVVGSGSDCHALRRVLQQILQEQFGLRHTTLQVDHEAAPQPPLQIETPAPRQKQPPGISPQARAE